MGFPPSRQVVDGLVVGGGMDWVVDPAVVHKPEGKFPRVFLFLALSAVQFANRGGLRVLLLLLGQELVRLVDVLWRYVEHAKNIITIPTPAKGFRQNEPVGDFYITYAGNAWFTQNRPRPNSSSG